VRATPDTVVSPDGNRVRLAPGSHSDPREGVCIVELAAVIAREEFSDRPRCVCPVIGAFLRGFNDRASHAARQRLLPYATRIVNTRADREITRTRRDICLRWAGAQLDRGPLRRLLARIGMSLRIAMFCGLGAALRPNEGAGDYAARIVVSRADTQRGLELLEALLAAGGDERRGERIPVESNGHGSMNGNGAVPSPVEADVSTNGHGPAEEPLEVGRS
jgi:hypothetical protein